MASGDYDIFVKRIERWDDLRRLNISILMLFNLLLGKLQSKNFKEAACKSIIESMAKINKGQGLSWNEQFPEFIIYQIRLELKKISIDDSVLWAFGRFNLDWILDGSEYEKKQIWDNSVDKSSSKSNLKSQNKENVTADFDATKAAENTTFIPKFLKDKFNIKQNSSQHKSDTTKQIIKNINRDKIDIKDLINLSERIEESTNYIDVLFTILKFHFTRITKETEYEIIEDKEGVYVIDVFGDELIAVLSNSINNSLELVIENIAGESKEYDKIHSSILRYRSGLNFLLLQEAKSRRSLFGKDDTFFIQGIYQNIECLLKYYPNYYSDIGKKAEAYGEIIDRLEDIVNHRKVINLILGRLLQLTEDINPNWNYTLSTVCQEIARNTIKLNRLDATIEEHNKGKHFLLNHINDCKEKVKNYELSDLKLSVEKKVPIAEIKQLVEKIIPIMLENGFSNREWSKENKLVILERMSDEDTKKINEFDVGDYVERASLAYYDLINSSLNPNASIYYWIKRTFFILKSLAEKEHFNYFSKITKDVILISSHFFDKTENYKKSSFDTYSNFLKEEFKANIWDPITNSKIEKSELKEELLFKIAVISEKLGLGVLKKEDLINRYMVLIQSYAESNNIIKLTKHLHFFQKSFDLSNHESEEKKTNIINLLKQVLDCNKSDIIEFLDIIDDIDIQIESCLIVSKYFSDDTIDLSLLGLLKKIKSNEEKIYSITGFLKVPHSKYVLKNIFKELKLTFSQIFSFDFYYKYFISNPFQESLNSEFVGIINSFVENEIIHVCKKEELSILDNREIFTEDNDEKGLIERLKKIQLIVSYFELNDLIYYYHDLILKRVELVCNRFESVFRLGILQVNPIDRKFEYRAQNGGMEILDLFFIDELNRLGLTSRANYIQSIHPLFMYENWDEMESQYFHYEGKLLDYSYLFLRMKDYQKAVEIAEQIKENKRIRDLCFFYHSKWGIENDNTLIISESRLKIKDSYFLILSLIEEIKFRNSSSKTFKAIEKFKTSFSLIEKLSDEWKKSSLYLEIYVFSLDINQIEFSKKVKRRIKVIPYLLVSDLSESKFLHDQGDYHASFNLFNQSMNKSLEVDFDHGANLNLTLTNITKYFKESKNQLFDNIDLDTIFNIELYASNELKYDYDFSDMNILDLIEISVFHYMDDVVDIRDLIKKLARKNDDKRIREILDYLLIEIDLAEDGAGIYTSLNFYTLIGEMYLELGDYDQAKKVLQTNLDCHG
ncbi:hypothetical protein N8301_05740 [Cyclobacteriaceae bacterium]|nr:hypothetical protein [Cyclobacteriaceae bacterium]